MVLCTCTCSICIRKKTRQLNEIINGNNGLECYKHLHKNFAETGNDLVLQNDFKIPRSTVETLMIKKLKTL